jgi:hypothetical protein
MTLDVKVTTRRAMLLAGLLAVSALPAQGARAEPEKERDERPATSSSAAGTQPNVSPYAKANRRRAQEAAAAPDHRGHPHPATRPVRKAPRSGGARR